MPTAAMQEQKDDRTLASRAFERARDWFITTTGLLENARKGKKAVRVIELESELVQAKEALEKADREYFDAHGVHAPVEAQPQPRPGTVAALRAANAEFRQVDDQVASLERERDRLLAQITVLEASLEKERAVFSFPVNSNPIADAVLGEIYPDVRPNLGDSLRSQNIARMSIELAGLRERLRKIEADRLEASAKRDVLFRDSQRQAK